MNNQTACCNTIESYVSHLQRQSFVTNLQALDCAASLGIKLQKVNVSKNIYKLCHISLKDFSVQGKLLFKCHFLSIFATLKSIKLTWNFYFVISILSGSLQMATTVTPEGNLRTGVFF